MENLRRSHRPDICRLQRDHRNRLTSSRHELDLKRLAVAIDVDDRSDISRLQAMVRNATTEDDGIQILNHRLALQILEDPRRSHAAANAHGHHAVAAAAAFHLVDDLGGELGAGGT